MIEKNRWLCNFMGWQITPNGMCITHTGESFDIERYDLYHPRRMQFAWQVFHRAYNSDYHDTLEKRLYSRNYDIFEYGPKDAMGILLDEVVYLITHGV